MQSTEAKQAAVEQWTADPCGYDSDHEPGSRPHMEDLDAGLRGYAPWMEEILDYEHTRGLRVLDVGCGQGIDMMRYARAGAQVSGIDLTPRHAELARLHLAAMGLDATIVDGDAESMPFADMSFDRVSSNGVLHHTPDMLAALREIRRVLVPAVRRG
jgi:ubiquinone/menaquinone biosynthesis C-methylase UbiE